VDKSKKSVTNACYDKQHACTYLSATVLTLMGCLYDPAFIQLAESSMVIRKTGGL